MYYYDVQTKDGRTHGGCHETKEELLATLEYFELTYANPEVQSVRVYEK
jgi:hypothetical protein